MSHFSYKYGYIIMESFWRVPYKKRKRLLKDYPACVCYEGFPSRKQDLLTFIACRFPATLNIAISLGKPALYVMLFIHRLLKK